MRGQRLPDVDVDDVGGFTVEQVLGSGACGVVYRATRGGEVFALKLTFP